MMKLFMRVVILLLAVAAGASAAAAPAMALLDAVRNGDGATLRVLLRQHVDVNAPGPDGTTALHWAAHRGDLSAVEQLLRAGARVDATNAFGVTPLSLAVENGDRTVIARLLQRGADPNTTAPQGDTVLMAAARSGNVDIVRALVAAGADVNARESTRGQTALMWAAVEGHAEVVHQLVQSGADIKVVSHGPSSAPDVTGGASLYKRNTPRVDLFTALQFAVQAGRVDAARELLDAGASLDDQTPQGFDVLTLAIANAHYDMAMLLIEHGADVNAWHAGWSPLHQVVRMRTLDIGMFPHPQSVGHYTTLDVAKSLLAYGASIDSRTTKRFSDAWQGNIGVGSTPFLQAAKGADVAMMRLLASNGADVTATNANGSTAIGLTAGMEMANPNQDSGTDSDALDALTLALALGAGRIDAANKDGDTALHAAVFRATPAAIRVLAAHGASLTVKNKRGTTPIDDALKGIPGGSASKTIAKPEAAKALYELMVARGLPAPNYEIDKSRFNFGVEVTK
jgi:ankyrin repeat protein